MGYMGSRKPPERSGSKPAGASEPARVPGKRTLTMGLSTSSARPSAPVQQQRDPAAEAMRQERDGQIEQWLATAVRPDLASSPVQRKSASEEHGPAAGLSASGGGQSLPTVVQAKMEGAFGVDFSAVRVHQDASAEAIGAAAYTQGTHLHFAPGQYDPGSHSGQELLGHELAHVVQQSQNRVPTSVQGKGAVSINTDPALEQEADVMGARAALGQPVQGAAASTSLVGSGERQPVQRQEDGKTQKGEPNAEQGQRELTAEELQILYPAEHVKPVALSAFSGGVVQAAFTAKRNLGPLPFRFGHLYHEHIFFEDGLPPSDIGHMGAHGLAQDASGGAYTRKREGLDDARMRQAVAQVGNPGPYSLLRNNCQDYVRMVLAAYDRLTAEAAQ